MKNHQIHEQGLIFLTGRYYETGLHETGHIKYGPLTLEAIKQLQYELEHDLLSMNTWD